MWTLCLKINFRNRILGKQYLTVPRNSTVDLWEKKPCYDTCNRAQTAWKGNNLACNACYALDMNARGELKENYDGNALTSPWLQKRLKNFSKYERGWTQPKRKDAKLKHKKLLMRVKKSRCDESLTWDQIWINESRYQRFEWPHLNIGISTFVWRWNCSRA